VGHDPSVGYEEIFRGPHSYFEQTMCQREKIFVFCMHSLWSTKMQPPCVIFSA